MPRVILVGAEARTGASPGSESHAQEWEPLWQWREGHLLAYPTIFAQWIPRTSVLPNPVVSLLPLSHSALAVLTLTTLSGNAPGHHVPLVCRWPLAAPLPFPLPIPPPLFLRAGPLRAFFLLQLIHCHGITYQPFAGGSQICVSSTDASHVFQPSGSNHPLGFLNISNFTCPDNSQESIVFCQHLVCRGPGHSYPRHS